MAQPLAAPYCYFADSNGAPLAGGFVYTYAAGTNTLQNSYTDSTGVTPNANPVVLDSAGRAQIWLSGTYKIVVKDSLGNTIATPDNITALANSGDMTKAIYDAANVAEQLAGLTAVQTLTNKTLTSPTIQSLIPRIPQGRLTLVSATPIMTSDQTAKTAIYYTPYVGDCIPVYNGTYFVDTLFTELTLTLDTTNHPTTKVYDVYASLQSGILTLSAMYWGSNTSRSTSAAGKSGSGNASITQKNGIWVNNAAISVSDSFNSTTGYAISQYQGTYLGTFYTTANGQTGVALKPSGASGGGNNIIGLWNTYNRVPMQAESRDNISWTYATNTWRSMDASTSNRISFVDGLSQSPLVGRCACEMGNSTNRGNISVNLNSTSATPTGFSEIIAAANVYNTAVYEEVFYPQLGFNFIQAMENAPSGATVSFNTNNSIQKLSLKIDI